MDYGKFLYQEQKKEKKAKQKAHVSETKEIQVGLGTSQHDLEMKAEKADEWLKEGNRVKMDMRLKGREKYLDRNFIEERMTRLLNLLKEKYKIADGPKKGPRGITTFIEKAV